MGAVILFFMIVYILLCVVLVKLINWLAGKRKVYKYLAIAVCVLVPTWDVVLGALVYFPACLFVPKVAIYETAKTDGIYYEGIHDYIYEYKKRRDDQPLSERIQVGTISDVFQGGYNYVESMVNKKTTITTILLNQYQPISASYYRCVVLPQDRNNPSIYKRTSCVVIAQPMSRYMVKVTTKRIVLGADTKVETNTKRITDKATGKLMAEYHQVALDYNLPFFNWLGYYEHGERSTCPRHPEDYYYFDYNVLKPLEIKS